MLSMPCSAPSLECGAIFQLNKQHHSRHLHAGIRMWFWGASWDKEGCVPLQTSSQPGLAGLGLFPALSWGATGSHCGACRLSP